MVFAVPVLLIMSSKVASVYLLIASSMGAAFQQMELLVQREQLLSTAVLAQELALSQSIPQIHLEDARPLLRSKRPYNLSIRRAYSPTLRTRFRRLLLLLWETLLATPLRFPLPPLLL